METEGIIARGERFDVNRFEMRISLDRGEFYNFVRLVETRSSWKVASFRLRGDGELLPVLHSVARSNMIQKCQQYPDNYITGLRGRRREMDVATREVGLLLRGMRIARAEEEVATDRAQGDFPADL